MSETTKEITKELIITSRPSEVQMALLEDKKLVELHQEQASEQFSLGNVYLGKIRKIMPGLNAAFVNIGCEKDAFLHYLDICPTTYMMGEYVKVIANGGTPDLSQITKMPIVPKVGKISDVFSTGQSVLVQIAKESISTKGPRVSTEISFAGRFVVLIPFSDKILVSQKIKGGLERKRLRQIVSGLRPQGFGMIIRTVAQDTVAQEIERDIEQLLSRWNAMIEKLTTARPPVKVASELDRTSVLVRDLLNDSFNAIHIDDKELYNEVKHYVSGFSDKDIVKLYKDKNPIFEHFNVSKQIKASFGKIVTIKSGIYLIIEQTEALCVIDVNSGNRIKSANSQEENALQVNMAAAEEIARQLRLRDIGGIIVIDFIDMRDPRNRNELHQKMTTLMASDRARHKILPLSKFGLMQITRQRVRPVTTIDIQEKCPVCYGTGKVKPTVLLIENIENIIEFLLQKNIENKITIEVHPFIYAYLTKGLFSIQCKWFMKYKKWIKLRSSAECHLLQYKFYNKYMEEIVLWDSQPQKKNEK